MTFDAFWQLYPRRVAKLAASKAWSKLRPADCAAALAALPAHVALWSQRSIDHIPHAASWLNGRRWEDELAPARAGALAPHRYLPRQEPRYDLSWQDECISLHGANAHGLPACGNSSFHAAKMSMQNAPVSQAVRPSSPPMLWES